MGINVIIVMHQVLGILVLRRRLIGLIVEYADDHNWYFIAEFAF